MSTRPSNDLIAPTLLGATLNILGFGFLYGTGNHVFELAMLNWMRDPSMYPNDSIREAFARFPTLFWKAVSLAPSQISTEAVLFTIFLLTKVLFFSGLARIVSFATSDMRLTRMIVVLFALSPPLNSRMPFGADHLLNSIQTHTELAIAVLVWAGGWLLEGRWIGAVVLTAASIYLSAPFAIYMLFAIAVFAAADRGVARKKIIASGFLGMLVTLPFAGMAREHVVRVSSPDYVRALLLFYPFHLRFSSHHPKDWILGPGFILLAAAFVLWAPKAGVAPNRRLELMSLSFAFPVMLGIIAGEWFLTPMIARLQLMRADSFLILYSALLLAAAAFALAGKGRLPLGYFGIAIGALPFFLPLTPLRLFLSAAGLPLALWSDTRKVWSRVIGEIQKWARRGGRSGMIAGATLGTMIALIYAVLLMGAWKNPRTLTQFSFPGRPLDDWSNVQIWARMNTPREAVFLVPTGVAGFRVLSQRSSWGEWEDGVAVYLYPPLASPYIASMAAVGFLKPTPANGYPFRERYESLSPETLLAIARENRLSYIIQYRETPYPAKPVYENSSYAVYQVPP